MKKFIIASMAIVLIHVNAEAEIKNGYIASNINDTRLALDNLKEVFADSRNRSSKSGEKLTRLQKQKLRLKIDSLEHFVRYYELTEELLAQFKIIAIELFSEIDGIKDENGVQTDVYVKFVPKDLMNSVQNALVRIYQRGTNSKACYSEYGNHSVSVIVAADIKPLRLLAHEFGHIKYQIPHFVEYVEYYKKSYLRKSFTSSFIGHNDKDPSGKVAMSYEQRYRQLYMLYRKHIKDVDKAPIALAK